ncbi:MAG TPA: alpha/beta fold hydrolase [Actinomycetota bacterium]|nr:alpha/beta fold hydrolase [Actinomycetota bacterium]
MAGGSDTTLRLGELPARFVGGVGVSGRWRLSIGRCKPRDVVAVAGRCRVEPAQGTPDVEIITDSSTWVEIDEGRSSGIEAFTQNRLWVRGSIQRALEFELLFDRAFAGGLRYEIRNVEVGGRPINVLSAGDEAADPLLLIHGLAATKSSWLTIVPELARHHRVMVVDLPGFGYSAKPRARYDAAFFAREMFGFLDALGIDNSFVAGNSMGGWIAMEMAITAPDRVRALACLCPASAFFRRPGVRLVRLLRPELAAASLFLPRARVKAALKQLFADPECLDDRWYDAAIDEFFTMWRTPRFRIAVAAAARRIYLEEPSGEKGFWARLGTMQTPALYIYGRQDVLISSRFAATVTSSLPHANVEVWDDCGHVPQIEFPERTIARVVDFFSTSAARSEAV